MIERTERWLRELFNYRFMFRELVARELKGRYRNTLIGYLWHLVNPISMVLIFMLVFSSVFGRTIDDYWIYLCSGMFPWHLFSSALNSGCHSIIGNAEMVKKMYFPRDVLVYSTIASSLINFTISYIIVITLVLLSGHGFDILALIALPFVVALLTVFSTGWALALSAATVYVRDVAYGVGIVTMLWIWVTPILYMMDSSRGAMLEWVLRINPLTYFIECFHSILYDGVLPHAGDILVCSILAAASFIIGITVFKRLERGFSERL
ncbi:MAG: ABC transporter permease [Gudongella sp.]|nr:ABC transporter permease [Gudongella sp.]